MNLSEELLRIREYQSGSLQPPANEANTCGWIIKPLLHHCGYTYHEIDEQAHDGAGNIPDFTLLPNTPHTWFLEAKKWTVALTDLHVNQAAGYASTTGKRWVVLSNGKEWRLYDNFMVGVPPVERRVITAKLDCGAELEGLLGALSKASAQSGALEKYVNDRRLNSVLAEQLKAPNSEVISAIRDVLKRKFGLASVTSAEVAAYFQAVPAGSADPALPISTGRLLAPPDVGPPVPLPPPVTDSMTLRELMQAGTSVNGARPDTLAFPDGTTRQDNTWHKITVSVIEWLLKQGKQPAFPFTGLRRGMRPLISITPPLNDGSRPPNVTMNVNGQNYYVFTERTSENLIIGLNMLCEEVGEAADGFKVTLK